jgi:hypothetical protein
MMWNVVHINSCSDNTGAGALDICKAFHNKKSGDQIENSQSVLTLRIVLARSLETAD